jgi:hypothetical protein
MNATKRLLLVLVLAALGFGCSGDDADAGDAAPDAAETEDGSPDPCFAVVEGWEDLLASTASANASCFTAADCTLLTHDLACEGGTSISTCGAPVSLAGEAAAKAELQAASSLVCEQHPSGCVSSASCVCVLPLGDEGTSYRLACLEHRCSVVDTVSE